MPGIFLYAPQDFRNLCAVARTLEVLGQDEVHVFDPWRLIRDRYGKSRTREMRDVSSGAFSRIRWVRIDEPSEFLREATGRLVATVADSASVALTEFSFLSDDLLLFGGESRGLPNEIVALADAKLTIPSRGHTQSLNLGVALGIVVFEAQRQSVPSSPPLLDAQAALPQKRSLVADDG